MSALAAGTAQTRRAAADGLGALGDSRAADSLCHALGDENSAVRESVARALGALGVATGVQALIRALGDGVGTVRTTAAASLAKLGQPQWSRLVKGVDEDFMHLGESGDPACVEPLIEALKNAPWAGRKAAANGCVRLAACCPSALIGRWQELGHTAKVPHTDSRQSGYTGPGGSDCHSDKHSDAGVGLRWPEAPPQGKRQQRIVVCPNPQCSTRLTVPVGHGGQRGRCPGCGHTFDIPPAHGGVDASTPPLDF